jgi:hypothetical protein
MGISKPGTKGFDLPRGLEQSTRGARDAYARMWEQEWPHDDAYLRQLARAIRPGETHACAVLLNAMREQDDTIPASYGAVTHQ